MTIKFVNHSCFIIEHNGVSIISDPWLEGKVFNNGWDLLSKTQLAYDDFKDINYIWFSHEHPDHFYPPNLKMISPEHKKNITVLFQNTIDGRVANYCRKAGFKEVIEMQKKTWYDIGKDFKVLCEYFGEGDSWIAYKAGDITILNTNDCGIRTKSQTDYIKNSIGKPDVLLTQFSYAYWVGNKEAVAYRKKMADEKLEWMKFQCDMFQPTVTIPIASYIYFCHEENYFLNDSMNTAEKTYHYLKNNTNTAPVILYNGEEYHFPEKWDSQKSIDKYSADFNKIELSQDKLVKNNKVELDELFKQAKIFTDNLKTNNSFIVANILRPTRVHLFDYNKTFVLSVKNGLEEKEIDYNHCDISMSSESLLFCLKFPYGLDTTHINGRLQKPVKGHYSNFHNIFRIDQLKSRGQEMNLGYLLGAGVRKVKMKLGLIKE